MIMLGNGGSAAIASHYVADLLKTAAAKGQRPLRVISLVDNVPMMTAIGNDISYDARPSAFPAVIQSSKVVAIRSWLMAVGGSGSGRASILWSDQVRRAPAHPARIPSRGARVVSQS